MNHPFLHFSAEDIPVLRQRAKTTHARHWSKLVEAVQRTAEWNPSTIIADEDITEYYAAEAGTILTNTALAYLISGNQDFLQLASHYIQDMCAVPKAGARNYGMADYVMGLCRAYDWLRGELTVTDRTMLVQHIAKTGRLLFEMSFPDHPRKSWWSGCYLHHDHWIPTAGYGIAGLTIRDEVPEARQWVERARGEFDTAFALLGDDGSWHEGPSGWCYGMSALLMFLDAYSRVEKTDLFDNPWLRRTARYRLYCRIADESFIGLSDSPDSSGRYHTTGSASSHLLRKLASVYRDTQAQWLADRAEPGDVDASARQIGPVEYWKPWLYCAAWNVLWHDPSVAAVGPEQLPLDAHFPNLGLGISRSDWSDAATAISFTCGPVAGHVFADDHRRNCSRPIENYYHGQANAGSFSLHAGGGHVIRPPGYGARDARFHNGLMINGHEARYSASAAPTLMHVVSTPEYAYYAGDLSNAYAPALGAKSVMRSVLFLRPRRVLIFDAIELGPAPDLHQRHATWMAWTDYDLYKMMISADACDFRGKNGEVAASCHFQPNGAPLMESYVHGTKVRSCLSLPVIVDSTWRHCALLNVPDTEPAPTPLTSNSWHGWSMPIGGVDHVVAFHAGASAGATTYTYSPFSRSKPKSRHLLLGLEPGQKYALSFNPLTMTATCQPGRGQKASAAGIVEFAPED